MSEAVRPLLPVLEPGTAPTRTVGDRLEMLSALIAAPSFDPLFRPDVIAVPPDHPTFGWTCGVPQCQRALNPGGEFCFRHSKHWAAFRREHGKNVSVAEFFRAAEPLQERSWFTPPACLICPDTPAWNRTVGLCYLHSKRWPRDRNFHRAETGEVLDFALWMAGQPVIPSFGHCRALVCPEQAVHLLGLCRRHVLAYERDGRPGGAQVPRNWGRMLTEWKNKNAVVSYRSEEEFKRWCRTAPAVHRANGKVSLRGLRPLVKAELKWAMFHYTKLPEREATWTMPWLQNLANHCRDQTVDSLADLDLETASYHATKLAHWMLTYLRLVYFSREDTKDAGFIETDQFGVRFKSRSSHFDLTAVSQRWLRDLLWDSLSLRLLTHPPRSGATFDQNRRGCVELSAFLEVHAPGGGHDPRGLTESLAIDFVADQRHRAEHGLMTLGIQRRGGGHVRKGKPTKATKNTVAHTFSGVRRIMREAMEGGKADELGLDRAFIVALPVGKTELRRRSPFPDDVARALAHPDNLQKLDDFDINDRGLRDAWEALVLTGRRCNEVLQVRLECIGRLGKLPMFWHDQTKVGNFDQAIRIPERLFQRIQERQAKTVARFVQRHGRPPTPRERKEIALFPRQARNRDLLKGVSYGWFGDQFRDWVETLDLAHCVPHQARHTLATNLLKNGANLTHVKRYLGQVSEEMAEHYVHLANTDPRLEEALQIVWVAGPGSAEPGTLLSGGEPMSRQEAEALAIDLARMSTPSDGGFCTFQPVVDGDACPFNLDCHNCDKFVLSGADLVYWHRKREQWRVFAEGAPDSATADYLHDHFAPTARAIDGLEKALGALGLLEEALALDLRRPQDYFGKVWATAFQAQELARWEEDGDGEAA
ncbi:tyrosine-type recombinase/integrase [Streptomyces sp. NPDC102437]|uniref:tyrosine-type recombinase/integrase n=1 Tax=Streptomyces sp. NPDC102437 TaxID=3366175 RepID=UPI00381003B2